jgi:two-component system, chemotaxis family, response regulator Rcp1
MSQAVSEYDKPMRILIAEDDEDHALLTELAIRAAQPELATRLEVATVAHGREALAYLRAQGVHAGRELPDLLLLDLKMPDVGGLEVLRALRADADLRTIPVIVLSTSARDQDVLEAFRLGADDYIAKPLRAEEFRAKVRAIPAYWSRVAGAC